MKLEDIYIYIIYDILYLSISYAYFFLHNSIYSAYNFPGYMYVLHICIYIRIYIRIYIYIFVYICMYIYTYRDDAPILSKPEKTYHI